MKDAFICDAVRTPIGRYGGALAAVRADDLGALPIRALIERNTGIQWSEVDDVVYGCANQAGEDNRNVARMSALLAGLPVDVPGTTINRLCGSGMDAVGYASRAIRTGEAQLVVAGGVESMSRAPFVLGKAETAFSRSQELYDTTIGWRFINKRLASIYGTHSMPETAEEVAAQFGVSRADQDAFALRSQQKATAARDSGRFTEEIIPVSIPQKKRSDLVVEHDEHIRADASLEALSALGTPFRQNGSVTAGNSSGVNDGACALLLASENAVKDYGLSARAKVRAMAVAGIEPRIMGAGPVAAVHKVLRLVGLTLADMDVIELNEAFAAQSLAVLRELGLADDAANVNPNGGAIALGHPLGMSGARLVTTAMIELERTGGLYALCTMCVGVGQGIAMVIERCDASV
nr:3-oxoadipyl-CoA thiolase [Pseudohongiella spirulinae]